MRLRLRRSRGESALRIARRTGVRSRLLRRSSRIRSRNGSAGRRTPLRSRLRRAASRLRMLTRMRRGISARSRPPPDDHLHLRDLATFGLQSVDHTAHSSIDRDNPGDQEHDRDSKHDEPEGHKRERGCDELGQLYAPRKIDERFLIISKWF